MGEALKKIYWWIEEHCWWLPMVISIIAITLAVTSIIFTIGAQLAANL